MNRPNPFASNGFFKPPTHLLGSTPGTISAQRRRTPSLDDSDTEAGLRTVGISPTEERDIPRTNHLTPDLSSEQSSVPLIESSRSPSPLTRNKDVSDAEREMEIEIAAAQSRPLLEVNLQSNSSAEYHVKTAGIGQFLYGTTNGWTIYVGLLICLVGGCQSGRLLTNDSILRNSTNKFAYPLTMTLIQLVVTHILLLTAAALTRHFKGFLQDQGMGYAVAPSQATRKTRATRHKSVSSQKPLLAAVQRLTNGSGGISGGGLLEWQQQSVSHALPAAVVFTVKLVMSNLSYAHTALPIYTLSRIAIVPLSLLFTATLLKTPHSVQTLLSAVLATFALLVATMGLDSDLTWKLATAGVLSSVFAALYPVTLLRAYRQIMYDLVPLGDALMFKNGDQSTIRTGTKEETRACWRTLHYISLLSIIMALPFVLVSGELWDIHKNFSMTSVSWFWSTMICGGMFGCTVFSATLFLVKATSPLTVNVVYLPRSALQLAFLSPDALPVHSLVGVMVCWISSAWYMLVRMKEGSRRDDRLD